MSRVTLVGALVTVAATLVDYGDLARRRLVCLRNRQHQPINTAWHDGRIFCVLCHRYLED